SLPAASGSRPKHQFQPVAARVFKKKRRHKRAGSPHLLARKVVSIGVWRTYNCGMNECTDSELLARFAQSESEEAFAALVRRHVHLVHSVALRHTASAHSAEEITQAVFVILARKACSLSSKTILSGWLYHTARLTAANFQRAEWRRTRRE